MLPIPLIRITCTHLDLPRCKAALLTAALSALPEQDRAGAADRAADAREGGARQGRASPPSSST
eukprot:2037651-Rhodomonas_salina.2